MQRLSPGKWLNDELVNAYASLCNQNYSNGKKRALNTWFWSSLSKEPPKTGYPKATKSLLTVIVGAVYSFLRYLA